MIYIILKSLEMIFKQGKLLEKYMTTANRQSDPYQWFFPLGIFFGLAGVVLWVLFGFKVLPMYPTLPHAEIMTGGFLTAIVTGFLMTAVPRFTGTRSAGPIEKWTLLVVFLLMFVTAFRPDRIWFHLGGFLAFCLLIRFGISRLRVSVFKPGPPFVLVAFGIFSGVCSFGLLLAKDFYPLPSTFVYLARMLLYYGLFFFPALGVGTQLIPSILGVAVPVAKPIGATPFHQPIGRMKVYFLFLVYGAGLFFSFVLEALGFFFTARLLRAVLVSAILFIHWHLHRRPKPIVLLTAALWLSGWMMFVGVWVVALWRGFAVHGAHILFIGSLSVMIFSVMTRVVISHGGHNPQVERNSKALLAMLIFFMVALVTRVSAPLVPNYYFHLAYAAFFWIAGVVCWMIIFFPKIIRK
ncbi:MAG: NnrS family protein [Deltaproteobacteria bacterium]|nr:NnrS family protein [Deltaproteobacteria bacterium]